MHKQPLRKLAAFSIWPLLISGCSSLGDLAPGGQQRITIDSDPSQATVLANGANLGVTPLTFDPSDAFNAGFTGGGDGMLTYRYKGKLVVKKPGCNDYVTEVNDNLLSRDISIKLECDPEYRPPAVPTAATSAPDVQEAIPASAEERLLRIDALHKKGLISDDEHRTLRKKVLDTL